MLMTLLIRENHHQMNSSMWFQLLIVLTSNPSISDVFFDECSPDSSADFCTNYSCAAVDFPTQFPTEVRISFSFLGPFGYWLDGLQSHVTWKIMGFFVVMEEHLLFFWWFSEDWHQSLSLLCLRLISFNMESWLVSGAEMTVVMQLAGMVHQLKVILIFLSMKLNYSWTIWDFSMKFCHFCWNCSCLRTTIGPWRSLSCHCL